MYTPCVRRGVYTPGIPTKPVITYPGLFPTEYGTLFFPHHGVNYLSMGDALRIQALFAARQFLTTRCRERGIPGVSAGNPWIVPGRISTMECLYSELSLLSASLGALGFEMARDGARRTQAMMAYYDFAADMLAYAPWLEFPQGPVDFYPLVEQSQAKLVELRDMIEAYDAARFRFEQAQFEMLARAAPMLSLD
jgi:hypothetical protein